MVLKFIMKFWVVPNTGHYVHDGDHKTAFLRLSKAFLK